MELRILAVDDEPSVRKLYDRLFSGGPYTLTLAESVAQATKLMETSNYDLLISDLMLPDGNGLELVRRFRESGPGRSIIVSGAMPEEVLARVGKKEGVLRTFPKPFELDELMKLVSNCVGI